MATMVGDEEGAREALAQGANPNYVNENGITPLLVCCGGVGPASLVAALLRAGARHDLCDPTGWSPLIFVASSGQIPLLEHLLAAGADVNHRAKDKGWSPLTRAAFRGQSAVVQVLLARGADSGSRTSSGATALDLAKLQGHLEVVALLSQLPELAAGEAEA
jgi:ankyrin repeat protein